jgi:hypothetical protein
VKERGVVDVRLGWEGLEAALAAGEVCCPDCEEPLRRWGYAREREVRMRHGARLIRPRRAYCRRCTATHVLFPAFCVPRRRDCVEVIGSALLAAADGVGHRTIAARLDRPPGTVRGWLRAASRHADALRACGVRWAITLSEPPARSSPFSSPLHTTVDALASAALAWKLRVCDLTNPPWEVAAALTGGGLLNGRPRDPPT